MTLYVDKDGIVAIIVTPDHKNEIVTFKVGEECLVLTFEDFFKRFNSIKRSGDYEKT